jgi:hypothetical protein
MSGKYFDDILFDDNFVHRFIIKQKREKNAEISFWDLGGRVRPAEEDPD